MKILIGLLACLLIPVNAAPQTCGSYLGEKPGVSLEEAFPIALRVAHARIPDLDSIFALQSIYPRALKGDRKGMHWQFFWQEVPFRSGLRGVEVRVYLKDGSTSVQQIEEPGR